MNRSLATLLAVVMSAAAWSGCNFPTCGAGTKQVQQKDGTLLCQPVDAPAGSIPCDVDAGAQIVAGVCVSHIHCGPNTTYDPTTGLCTGTGTTGGLPTCVSPTDGTFCIVGQIFHFADDSPLNMGESVPVAIYDPFAFLANGPSTPPLASTTTIPGGYYKFDHVMVPSAAPEVAIAVGLSSNVLVATGAKVAGNNSFQLDGYTMDRSVVDAWGKNVPGGIDYVAKGAYLAKFYMEKEPSPTLFTKTEKTPVAGVTLLDNGAAPPTGVKYFGATLTAPPTGTSTGTSGAAITPTSGNPPGGDSYTGMGGGISWETQPGGSYPGVVFVARFHPM